jgi:formylglycine-generating enzyme required for sulfatase activity
MSYTTRRVYRYVEGKLAEKQMPEFLGKTNVVELVSLDRGRKEMPEFITTKVGQIKLKRIPAGEFLMGSPDDDKDAEAEEKPQHRVRITRPFYLGIYEVTQAQYETVMGENPSWFSATGKGKEKVAGQSTDQHPVEGVSWLDAVRFCNKLSEREGMNPFYQIKGEDVSVPQWKGSGYRLPTEAEWEYACRAGSKTRFSFGDEQAGLGEHGWFEGNAGFRTHPVGQLVPNGFGLYDMHGNAWEWCWDGYGENSYAKSPADDPTGPLGAAHRVIRGGSWSNYPRYCRSAYRSWLTPGYRFSGLRLALVQ